MCSYWIIQGRRFKLWLFLNLGYAAPSPPLKSDHLDIKDAQSAENKDEMKKSYHTSSRFWVMGDQKVKKDAQKIKFSSEVVKFAEKIGINLTQNFFCAILSFLDMIDFVLFPL